MYAIELYVPIRDNDGQAIVPSLWDLLEAKLVAMFNGYTRIVAIGAWKNDLPEHVVVYRVLISEDQDGISLEHRASFESLARYVKNHWRQETVLWTVTEVAEINFS